MVRKSQTPRRKPKRPSRPQDRLDLEALAAEQGVEPIALAFAPNGKVLATGSCDTTVRLWNLSSFAVKKP